MTMNICDEGQKGSTNEGHKHCTRSSHHQVPVAIPVFHGYCKNGTFLAEWLAANNINLTRSIEE